MKINISGQYKHCSYNSNCKHNFTFLVGQSVKKTILKNAFHMLNTEHIY